MAYTRGNLATQPQRKEEKRQLYREKTKVVTTRRVLPMKEKLLYMLTVSVFALVAVALISRYVHIYDLNMQAQKLDAKIASTKKEIAVYQKEKQTLLELVPKKAEQLGYSRPSEDSNIYVSPDEGAE
ncbi:cell division protein FtsL [Paenibacillus tengchongensis]|uniref:cell division protein FtsL n=1 Tax=Paenibacillus tengchongensis TaxID=2608684 RepID=UPI00124F2770|nr:cell division protein FtsL [Paenibacillus tengchongensis]